MKIDYNNFSYCSICEIKLPKETLRCKECNQKVRHAPDGNIYRTKFYAETYKNLVD